VVRDEKIFLKKKIFEKKFFLIFQKKFFFGGVGKSERVIEARKSVLNPSYYIQLKIFACSKGPQNILHRASPNLRLPLGSGAEQQQPWSTKFLNW